MRKIVLFLFLAFQINVFGALEREVRNDKSVTQVLRYRRVQSNHVKHKKTQRRNRRIRNGIQVQKIVSRDRS